MTNIYIPDTDRVKKAIALAMMYHHLQKRKGNKEPYTEHCFRVANMVAMPWYSGKEECVIAAILHDVLEDTCCTYGDIVEEFDEGIADTISVLTETGNYEGNRAHRKYEYRRTISKASRETKLIKACDVYDNLDDVAAVLKPSFLPIYLVEQSLMLKALDYRTPTSMGGLISGRLSEAYKTLDEKQYKAYCKYMDSLPDGYDTIKTWQER